jgi:hypothetical protein
VITESAEPLGEEALSKKITFQWVTFRIAVGQEIFQEVAEKVAQCAAADAASAV